MMRRVLVTGSNRGIGLALVREALERDSFVIATCRAPVDATELRELHRVHGDRIRILRLDLLDPSSGEECKREVASDVESLDVLVNNAGINGRDATVAPPASHLSIAALDSANLLRMFQVNTVAQLGVTQLFLPLLKKSDQARIGFLSSGMSSINGKDGSEIEYSYSISKAALNMAVRVLSYELRYLGIWVVALNPGWVRTDMGTSRAPLDASDSASGLWDRLDQLTESDSGRFLDYRGRSVPW